MKVVILAGGLGTRLAEETGTRPKPMVEIGGKPILWHIMRLYLRHGFDDFVICLGYKGYVIKEYFANYALHCSDVTFSGNGMKVHQSKAENWRVTLVDTGLETKTGGRLRKIRKYLGEETFMLTYGDGLADIDIKRLMTFHRWSGKLATVTSVRQPGRFGAIEMDDKMNIVSFQEKSRASGAWINGGFFVLGPGIFDYIESDDVMWEHAPIERLVRDNQLAAYPHAGFWQCMDTMRDKQHLEELWTGGNAPWVK